MPAYSLEKAEPSGTTEKAGCNVNTSGENLFFTHLSEDGKRHLTDTVAWFKETGKFLQLARKFLSAKQRSYQQNASAGDVEKVLGFCSDSVHYDHILSPKIKFSFSGKAQWRKGAISHLGETRNVKIKIIKYIQHQNVVIIEFALSREAKLNGKWKALSEKTVSIMEFDKNDRIKKVTDYL